MLLLASIAAAHPDASAHLHATSPLGLVVLSAWVAAAVLVWRFTRTLADDNVGSPVRGAP